VIRRFTVASIVVVALLIATARAIGSTHKPPALAILDPGDCPQPCWHGIRPGVTTVAEATAILTADSNVGLYKVSDEASVCWNVSQTFIVGCLWTTSSSTRPITNMIIWFPQDALRLGDIVNLLGLPRTIQACPYITDVKTTLQGQQRAVRPEFTTNVGIVAYAPVEPYRNKKSPTADPFMIGYYLYYWSPVSTVDKPNVQTWRGFRPVPAGTTDSCGAFVMPKQVSNGP
jgi:hypothetical protein